MISSLNHQAIGDDGDEQAGVHQVLRAKSAS